LRKKNAAPDEGSSRIRGSGAFMLSRLHTLLSSATWKAVDLHDLIRDQLLAGAVDETRLPRGDRQSNVALMLHELGTDKIKYGALSTATISWSVADAMFRTRWEERGGDIALNRWAFYRDRGDNRSPCGAHCSQINP
jgi:two-component sensor histidine kinase